MVIRVKNWTLPWQNTVEFLKLRMHLEIFMILYLVNETGLNQWLLFQPMSLTDTIGLF